MKKMFRIISITFALMMALSIGVIPAFAEGNMKKLSIKSIPSEDSLDEQLFSISNPNSSAVVVQCDATQGGYSQSISIPANGTKTIAVPDPGMSGRTVRISYEYNGSTASAFCSSTNSYWIYIQCRLENGQTIRSERKSISQAQGSISVSAPSIQGYKLISESALGHVYNPSSSMAKRTLVFTYKEIVPEPYNIKVSYLDAATGAVIHSVNVNVPVDGVGTHTAPQNYTTGDGKEYELAPGQNAAISHRYSDTGKTVYEVYYNKVAENPSKPYMINIRYQDASSGLVLASKNVTIPVGETVTYGIPKEFADANGKRYIREDGQPSSIVHKANNSTRRYVILFREDKNIPSDPYQIKVTYANAQTGKALESTTLNVAVNATVRHSAPASLTINGTKYTLSQGQSRNIAHAFAQGKKDYTIYYDAEGAAPVTPYSITIRYANAKTSEILFSTTVVVPIRDSVNYIAPAEYTADGIDYVLSNGQTQQIIHNYGDVRRVYYVFYKDANDEVDDNEELLPGDGTIGGLVDFIGGVINNEEENGTIINDNQTPQGETQIDDNQTPLAKNEKNSRNVLMYGGIGCGVIAALALILFFIKRKKEKGQNA